MNKQDWKTALASRLPAEEAHRINVFEGQLALMKQDKLDEKVFAETRLRKGVYGQRYDNGQRHNGTESQRLNFPQPYFKGPNTHWDAPGMQRIKIPFGALTPDQMIVLAEVADEYADGILHVTTRQDFQLHYVHIEDTPDMMRRLAAAGVTTEEACGNVVRNITCCQLAGVCRTEPFDVTPYARAIADFMLNHPDAQDFGRKVKIAFSGCEQTACGLVMMHDIGFLAQVREEEGEAIRGFKMFVGGGLGAIPQQAQVLVDFASEAEILPLTQAISRVFARHGEKKNRNRARIKFLVQKMGIEAFREAVLSERAVLPYDSNWTAFLGELSLYRELPLKPPTALNGQERPAGFDAWYATNIDYQRQDGYCVATIHLPLGDLTSAQMIQLADLARKYVGDHVRTTVEQNLVFRWVAEADLIPLYLDLQAVGMAQPGAGTIVDITACPGTDTCKLGIASSRGLARKLSIDLKAKNAALPQAIQNLRIKISGCFNSCGQHHVSDIGFFGNSRKAGNFKVPHFQVVLGGQWGRNAGSYGLPIGAVPSKRVPEVVDAITDAYVAGRTSAESFQDWVARLGKKEARELIRPYMTLPVFEEQPEYFSDWGDPRLFTLGDLGIGECAGEVVSLFAFEVARAESEVFDAQLALEAGDAESADRRAYQAMISAARALIRTEHQDVADDPESIVAEFKTRFFDNERFFDPFAKGKFGRYLLKRHANTPQQPGIDEARRTIDQAQLFIEATHACEMRLSEPVPLPAAATQPSMKGKLPPGFKR